MLLHKNDESFADMTTQVEDVAGIGGAHQGPDFYGPLGGVGDLQCVDSTVPQGIAVQQPGQFLA